MINNLYVNRILYKILVGTGLQCNTSIYRCKSTCMVVLTAEWLPCMVADKQTDSGYVLFIFANCISQPDRKFPSHLQPQSCRYSNH